MNAFEELKSLREEASAIEKTARATLHQLLGECFHIILKYADDPVEIYEAASKLDVKVTDKADLPLIVVRIVFGSDDRKRESSYAAFLRVALAKQAEVEAVGMSKWIEDNKGIEAVRRKNAKPKSSSSAAKALPHRRSLGVRVAKANMGQPIGTVAASALGSNKPTAEGFMLMLGLRDPATNNIVVVACDADEDRITQILAVLGDGLEVKEITLPSKSLSAALNDAAASADNATVEA